MHFRTLDLNLLVALDALLTDLNITEAGKRVHITQPAMSGALGRLRQYFGDELLVRVGQKMVPTPLGKSLAEPVKEILLKVRATVDAKPGFDPATSTRRFSLMMSDYVCTVLMGEVLKCIEHSAPHVSFEIVSNDVFSPRDALDHGDVDLLIMPQDYLSKEHPSEVLFTDSYACLAARDNPRVGEALSQEQYLELGHVCLQFIRGRVPVLDEWFLSRLGVKRRVEVLVMNFNSIPQNVLGTQRIATTYQRLSNYYCKFMPLRVIPCPFEMPVVSEAMQWHRYFQDDPGIAWLRSILKQVAAALTPAS